MSLPISPPPSRSSSQVSLNKLSPPQPRTISPPHSPKRCSRPVLKVNPNVCVPTLESPALRSFFSPCSSDEESESEAGDLGDLEDDDVYSPVSAGTTPLSMRPPYRRDWAYQAPPTPPPQSPPPAPPGRRCPSLGSPTFGSPVLTPAKIRRARRHTDPVPRSHNLLPLDITPSSAELDAAISLRDALTVQTQKAHLRRSHPKVIAALHQKLEAARMEVELATVEARALEELRVVAEVRKRMAAPVPGDDDDDNDEFFDGGVFGISSPSPPPRQSVPARTFKHSIDATLTATPPPPPPPPLPKIFTAFNPRAEEMCTPLELEENEFNIPLPSPSLEEIYFFATSERRVGDDEPMEIALPPTPELGVVGEIEMQMI